MKHVIKMLLSHFSFIFNVTSRVSRIYVFVENVPHFDAYLIFFSKYGCRNIDKIF